MTFLFVFQWSCTSASTWRHRVARVAHVPTLTVTRVAGATRPSCVRLRSSVRNDAISETTTKSVSTRASTGFVLHAPHTPAPFILRYSRCDVMFQIQPSAGPLEGGTRLRLDGENLGFVASDVQVKIGNIECVVDEENYEPASR